MVILVLAAFALGCAVGVLVMVPGWWRHRQEAKRLRPAAEAPSPGEAAVRVAPVEALMHRDGI